MTAPSFVSRSAAKQLGWFSRRHRTDEAHREAGRRWRERHVDKLARALLQAEETSLRKARECAEAEAKRLKVTEIKTKKSKAA